MGIFATAASIMACLGVGRLKDTLNGCIQEDVKFGIGLLGRQPLYQRPRKARHDTVIPPRPVVCLFPHITARQCHHPHDIRMTDEIGIDGN